MKQNAQGRATETNGSAPDDSPEKTICQLERERVDDVMPYWGPVHEGMDKQESFLDGERYVDDNGAYNLDRRLIQIKGNELADTIRHIAAKSTERPRSLEPRPVDEEPDATNGEIATGLVEREMNDPWKGYNGCEYAAIISCREKQLGVVMMDWEPDFGPYGEIFYRYVDPRRIIWDPAFESPHHPLCSWLREERRVSVSWIKNHFKNVKWVKSDQEGASSGGQQKPGVPLMRDGLGGFLGPGRYRDNKVTIWIFWHKNDETRKVKESEQEDQPIPDGERFMVCRDGCGYRSPTQDALQQDGYPDYEMPDGVDVPVVCPECEANGLPGTLERIDVKAQPWEVLAFQKGKRMVIMTPFQKSPDDEPLYDGDWQIPTARSFPGFFITHSVKPGRPVGYSDTLLMWDQQIASDNLATAAVERVLEHRNYFEVPAVGLNDMSGKRWVGRDDQFNVMIRDNSQAFPSEFKIHNGAGLDPMFPFAFQMTQQKLVQYRGMNDLGPIEDRSKAKSGVALQTENAIGEVPVEDFNRRKNEERAKFAGVLWDYIRATYTQERLARLRMNGIDLVVGLEGNDLPNYDFVIEDTPAFAGLEKARSEAWDAGVQVALQMPTLLEAWGKFHNVPKSVIRELQKAVQSAAPEVDPVTGEPIAPAMGGGMPGMDPAMGGGINDGSIGAGTEPALV